VAQAMDEKLLVRVTRDKPAEGSPGVAVRGVFDGYNYAHNTERNQRSCDYVCGTDSKPNPRRREVEQQLAQKEQSLSQVEDEIARLQKDVTENEQKIGGKEQDVQRAQQDYESKRADYERCRDECQTKYDACQKQNDEARAKGQSPSSSSCINCQSECSSKKSYMDSAQSSLNNKRSEISGPLGDLERARASMTSAQSRRESTRRERDQTQQELRNTPEMITVDRYCPFTYPVDIHTSTEEVTLKLTMGRLGEDKAIVSDQPFHYETAAKDETRPAHPGRCPEVASADPLDLPSEDQMKQELANKVIKDVRTKIVASYDAYRQKFLAEARRAEAAGLTEEATEAFVRYVLTGPHALEQKDQIAKFFAKTRGFTQLDALWSM
jgi:hypothetical protein